MKSIAKIMKRTAIIMAGGSGERFWPLSRKSQPKQLLKLSGTNNTMLRESILRIKDIIQYEDIFIITNELLLGAIRENLPELPPENIIAEPAKRNTAPCLALGAAIIAEKYKGRGLDKNQISIAVLTADHKIVPIEKFHSTVVKALDYVETEEALATIGIKPKFASTGFGYIEISADAINGSTIHNVIAFHEKPQKEIAEEFIRNSNFLWNSGMFFWRLDTFESAITECMPKVGKSISLLQDIYTGNIDNPLGSYYPQALELFSSLPNQSIDYGLIEKAKNVVVAIAEFDWEDIGSWEALMPASGNFEYGRIIQVDCDGNVLYNYSNRDMILTGIGLKDMVIVVTDDAVMISPKNCAQEIKKLVNILRDKGMEIYL